MDHTGPFSRAHIMSHLDRFPVESLDRRSVLNARDMLVRHVAEVDQEYHRYRDHAPSLEALRECLEQGRQEAIDVLKRIHAILT